MSITKVPDRYYILLFFFCIGPALIASAQFEYSSQNFRIERFTTENGLPSNAIKGLEWDDKTGFLWLATEAGMARYNGQQFIDFSKDNSPESPSDRMLFIEKNYQKRILAADKEGNIFFIMDNKPQFLGQARLDDRTSQFRLVGLASSGKFYRQTRSSPPDDFGFYFSVEQLVPLAGNRMLIAARDSLFNYIQGSPRPAFLVRLDPGSFLFAIGRDFFLFNPSQGFFSLDTVTFKKKPIAIARDASFRGPMINGHSRLFWEHGMPSPILLTETHAWTLSLSGGKLLPTLICPVVPADGLITHAQYVPKSKILFLGTQSKGLIVIRSDQVRSIHRTDSLEQTPSSYYSQIPLAHGAVLTDRGDILNGSSSDPTPIRRLKGGKKATFNAFVYRAPDSTLWYSIGDSLYAYSYGNRQTRSYYGGKGSITDGFIQADGKTYIVNAIGIGLLINNSVSYLYKYPKPDINDNIPFALARYKPDEILIATCTGLHSFNIRNRQPGKTIISGVCVRALWQYQDYMFAGTYGGGIFLIKGDSLLTVPLDKNKYLLYSHCFMPDSLGYCWISTNKGLFRARPEDMIYASQHDQATVYYNYYGRHDGMDITEMNGGCSPCAVTLQDSIISFPTMDGLAWVNSHQEIDRIPSGEIFFDKCFSDDTSVATNSLLEPVFPAGTRNINFSLGYAAWVDKENVVLDYRLENSKDWHPMDDRISPIIHLTNIAPGEHHLIVRKLNGFGKDNYSMAEFTFRIRQRWYMETWTWILGISSLVLVSLLAWLYLSWKSRYTQKKLENQILEKTRELRQKNEELERNDTIKGRLISIIGHDVITPLKFIHLAARNLGSKKENLTPELREEAVEEIINTSKDLEFLSTNLLNWIKYRNGDRRMVKGTFSPCTMVNRLFDSFKPIAEQKQVEIINEIDPALRITQMQEAIRIVLYNLILNGINFTASGTIHVSSAFTPEGFEFSIADTGIGMTEEQVANIMDDNYIISSTNLDMRKGNGLGYLIIKDLLKIIQGKIDIKSKLKAGTTVTLTIREFA